MDENGIELDDNDDESWSLPFEDCTSPPSHTASRADNPMRTYREQHSTTSADSGISTLGHARTIIHIDIDCFYAQVEMMRNPKLRDKPLGIQQKYLVVTCNYVARGYGVTKLMGVKEALDKCPSLVLVSGEDLTHYRQVSYKISEFLQQYTPQVERLGMDENFLDVSHLVQQRLESDDIKSEVIGHEYKFKNDDSNVEEEKSYRDQLATCKCGCRERLTVGSQIAADIRDALHQEMSITCCAGISYNKLLSKLVAGKHKPNQQTTLFPEQTADFMMTVGQVRRIPGIGHTTSKKLAALGIVSLQDLQQYNISDLKQELGPKQAAVIQQLSFGVDDSPIVTFGRPQTLSDEDSFKKCSTVNAVRSKVKELLASLTKRLLDDGRTPQTLRLTIRKLAPADKKWTNRESRQCPIPGHIMSSLSTGKLDRLIDQLEEITMTLFTKLVNTKEPFHLTLMNIAFSSMVEKSKNAISSFFTVRSPKHEVKNRETPGNSTIGQKSATTPDKEKEQNILQKWVVKSPRKLGNHSPDNFEVSRPNVSRSPKRCLMVQSDSGMSPDNGGNRKIDNVEFQKIECGKIDSSGIETLSCLKRKAEEAREDTKSYNKKKCLGRSIGWTKTESGTREIVDPNTGLKTTEAQTSIPKDVDSEIFLQLPEDIQREILHEEESRKGQRCSRKMKARSQDEQLRTNIDTDSHKNISNSFTSYFRSEQYFPQGREEQRQNQSESTQTSSIKENSRLFDIYSCQTGEVKQTEDTASTQSVSTPDYKPLLNTRNNKPSVSENPKLAVSFVHTTKKQGGDRLTHSTPKTDLNSNSKVGAVQCERSWVKELDLETNSVDNIVTDVCEESGYKNSCQSYQLPPHVDKEVFSNLPAEIQREYLSQWSRVPKMSLKSQETLTNKNKIFTTTSQARLPTAKHKPPNAGKASILNFFQSKNKK